MAKLTKRQITDNMREKYIDMISSLLSGNGEQVLRVNKNAISCPIVFENGDEGFMKIVISFPRGSRLEGDEYNAFAEAEDYELHCKENEEKRAAKQAELRKKKAAEEAAKRASES